MGFTAWYMLAVLPAGAQAIARLGFPPYFRVELAWAKLIGVVVLLAPVPPRLKVDMLRGLRTNPDQPEVVHLAASDPANPYGAILPWPRTEEMGLRWLRHQPRFGAYRPLLDGRWPGRVGSFGDNQRALGALVLLLAPPAGHAVCSGRR